MLIGTLSFAQETAKTENCTPSPACAQAMGISLEKCKKICGAKKGTSTANANANSNQEVQAKLVSQSINQFNSTTSDLKNCDPKECAKTCGMTVAECQKLCGSKIGSTPNNAEVQLVSQKVSQKTNSKKCCKIKCCKKGLSKNTATASN